MNDLKNTTNWTIQSTITKTIHSQDDAKFDLTEAVARWWPVDKMFLKILQINRKTPVSETCNFVKFLSIPFFIEHLRRLIPIQWRCNLFSDLPCQLMEV